MSGSQLPEKTPPAGPPLLVGVLRRRLTLASSAVGFAGLTGVLLLEPNPPLASAAALAGLGLAAGSWLVNRLAARDVATGRALSSAAEAIEEQELERIRQLKRQLSKSQYIDGAEDPGERALEQFRQAELRFKAFQQVLREKFEPSELTYGRYLFTAEKVQQAILGNLQRMATAFASIAPLEPTEAETELRALAAKAPHAPEHARMDALKERLEVWHAHLRTVRSLLVENDKALGELDRVTAALGAIRTKSGPDLESSLHDLEELAKRASKYSLS